MKIDEHELTRTIERNADKWSGCIFGLLVLAIMGLFAYFGVGNG